MGYGSEGVDVLRQVVVLRCEWVKVEVDVAAPVGTWSLKNKDQLLPKR